MSAKRVMCAAWVIGVISLVPRGAALAQQPPILQPAVADANRWVVSLDGTWQFAPEGSKDFAPAPVPGFWGNTPQAKAHDWQAAMRWKSGTYRREFQVPAGMTGAVLEFDQLRWGGEVLVNGRSAGTYDLGHSPAVFDISRLIKPGTNVLEVHPHGWTTLERYQGKDQKIPIGAGNWFGIKEGGIPDDVTLRFYNGARIEPLRISPRVPGMTLSVSAQITAGNAPWQGTLAVQIVSDDGAKAITPVQRVGVRVDAGKQITLDIEPIQAPGALPWTPASPRLYRLVTWLEDAQGHTAAVRQDTFGFREVCMRDGGFHLNGKPYRLFGATELVMYKMLELMDDPAKFQNVQVKLFKGMNAVAFRSHQNPLPRKWLDLCDRAGIMVLSEFPNFPDVQRQSGQSPYEIPGYWENLQREARGIVAARFNHPSIIGWVVSNEGTTFGDWERQNLVPFVEKLDRSRLVMLSGDVTPQVADQHNFAGMWWGTYAEFVRAANDLARFYPDRLVGCTEYGQYGPGKRWYGPTDMKENSQQVQEDLARTLMEETEALRRARFGLIMPYSYGGGWFGPRAGESGWPADAAAPYQAMRNALSPLGVSIDFRRHVMAGSKIEVPVWVLSDADDAEGPVQVNLYLLDRQPGYDWNGETKGFGVLAQGDYTLKVHAWGGYQRPISLEIPDRPGQAYLAAAVHKKGQSQPAAISLRPLRIHPALPAPARHLKVGVIEKDGRIAKWLTDRGYEVVLAYGAPRPDVIVIGQGMLNDDRVRTHGGPLAKRVLVGGTRMVILEQCQWDAGVAQTDMKPILTGLTTAAMQTAVENLFPQAALEAATVTAPGTQPAERGDLAVGTDLDFQRLNGLDNIAMRVALVPTAQAARAADSKAPARLTPDAEKSAGAPPASQPAGSQAASQPEAWTSLLDGYGLKGDAPGWALAHRTYGKGEVFACQVPIVERLDKTDAASFDPTAERLLTFLIEGQLPGSAR